MQARRPQRLLPILLLVPLLISLLLAPLAVSAQVQQAAPADAPAAPARALLVGVKVAPPFVIARDGAYSGLSIDLWNEIARERGWSVSFRQYELDALLDAVARGEVDAGLGAITATADRERRMDFSHPITSSGLGVAVRTRDSAGWAAVAGAFFSLGFLKVVAALGSLLLAVGALAWLAERRRNAGQFGGGASRGIGSGFWWAAVTMTTVGYGDKAPVTFAGRMIGLLWMFAALIIVSTFTAAITSALTVGQLSSRITGADDLGGVRVTSMADTTSAEWLARRGLAFDAVAEVDVALDRLADGGTGAVVYDAPLLKWTIGQRHRNRLEVLPFTLERQDYAFALPDGSPLREAVNASLLARINAPGWRERVDRYLGDAGD